MKILRFLALVGCVVGMAGAVLAQPLPPVTTPWSRAFLRQTNGVMYAQASGLVDDTPMSALYSQSPSSFGIDQTAKLQALLNTAKTNGSVHLIIDGRFTTGGLLVYSNTWIDILPNCGLVLKSSSAVPLIRNANQTAGNPVDVNITISGGVLNFNGGNQGDKLQAGHDGWGGGYVSGLEFIGAKGINIRDTMLLCPCSFTMYLLNTYNSVIERITINTGWTLNRDGIHWNGPGGNWIIRDCWLENVGDDGLALNANDAWGGTTEDKRPPLYGTGGPLTNFTIQNITYTNCFSVFRLLSSGSLIDGIFMDGLHGKINTRFGTIDNFDTPSAMIPANGNPVIGEVNIRNVDVDVISPDYIGGLLVNYCYLTNLTLENVSRKNATGAKSLLRIAGGVTYGTLNLKGWRIASTTNLSGNIVELDQPINTFRLSDSDFRSTGYSYSNSPVYVGQNARVTNAFTYANSQSGFYTMYRTNASAVIPISALNTTNDWQLDFAPSLITGLSLWLDATRITNANATALTNWYDVSGSNNHAFTTNGTGTLAPTFYSTGLNGKPSVYFHGTPQGSPMFISNSITARPLSIFAVVNTQSSRTNNDLRIIICKNSDYSFYLDALQAPNNNSGRCITVYDGAGGNNTRSADDCYTRATAFLAELTHASGAQPVLYANGSALSLTMSNTLAGTSGLNGALQVVGSYGSSTWHHNSYISEILVYNTVLSEANRLRVEAYLRGKWRLY